MKYKQTRPVLAVVMDGVGARADRFGNAVALAHTPNMRWLQANALYSTVKAHGTHVGMPSDQDMGNSEVGHNIIGAGRVFPQGATLVQTALRDGSIFRSDAWQAALKRAKSGGTLHFLGLLSDGNVHSHEDHLYQMLRQAHKDGASRLRVHVLLDGRDVPERSAEKYCERLEKVLSDLRAHKCDAEIASAGGRMLVTMDRYEADWSMVETGWKLQVLGEGPQFPSLKAGVEAARRDPQSTDQFLPGFVVADAQGQPCGKIKDGDAVLYFNFRGDRAIEVSRAFDDVDFDKFDRKGRPDVFYAGMMEYDGDLHIPHNYLVKPPPIKDGLGEYLVHLGQRQYACSETQKYGHVTYFWNGNRSGYLDAKLEDYVEVRSDNIPFQFKPWMKAAEITAETVERMLQKGFDFGRINFANGDMVGHTGDLDAAILSVSTVDLMLGQLIAAARQSDTALLITADHGNCEEMFNGKLADFPDWETAPSNRRPPAKTSHTLSEVPVYIYEPRGTSGLHLMEKGCGSLANLANTFLDLMNIETRPNYLPSLIRR